MRISDWSSDVCSSDLGDHRRQLLGLLRAWLGWLVVLGSGRERLADAVAGGDRAAPFGDRAGDARRVARVDGDARGGRLLAVDGGDVPRPVGGAAARACLRARSAALRVHSRAARKNVV